MEYRLAERGFLTDLEEVRDHSDMHAAINGSLTINNFFSSSALANPGSVILSRLWRRTFWVFKLTRRQEGLYLIVSVCELLSKCLLRKAPYQSLFLSLAFPSHAAECSERLLAFRGCFRSPLDLFRHLHLEDV